MTFSLLKTSFKEQEKSFWDYYRNRKILVAGFSLLTGYSLAKLFNQKKISYSIYDKNIDKKLKEKLLSKKSYCIGFLNQLSQKEIIKYDDILLSPGIPRNQLFIRHAIKNNIKVWNDFDFLYPLYKDKIIIAVTGTDGKTTVVKWLQFFFENNHDKIYLCGNVGIPIASNYQKLISSKVVVIELSSYMLEDIKQFRSNCSVIINVDKDHLNRYVSFQEYFNTKTNILKNSLSSDFFLWNIDDPFIKKIKAQKFNCQFLSFSLKDKNANFYFDKKTVYCNDKILTKKVALKNNLLNPYNFLIVFIVSILHQKSINKNLSLIKNFMGLEHRLEKVNRQIYNDSKATTVQAIHFAIESLIKKVRAKKINLILGGIDKGLDFSSLKKYKTVIHKIYIYGKSAEKIYNQIKNIFKCQLKKEFDFCVEMALQELAKESILLLSPGCASQDQFKNYMERGDKFKQKVNYFFKNQ